MPRVNDEIEAILSVESKQKEVITGRIKVNKVCLDTGLITVGPFKFVVNDQIYETDKLEVKVDPELPLSIVDGLWIRNFFFNSKRYIVIEQRISNKISKEKLSGGEVLINKSAGELLFAELNEKLLEDKGVSILSRQSVSGKKIIKLNDPQGSFSFKNTVYVYELTPEYRAPFKITKEYFKDFPGDTKIIDVLIGN